MFMLAYLHIFDWLSILNKALFRGKAMPFLGYA